jgi:hypothetical protein
MNRREIEDPEEFDRQFYGPDEMDQKEILRNETIMVKMQEKSTQTSEDDLPTPRVRARYEKHPTDRPNDYTIVPAPLGIDPNIEYQPTTPKSVRFHHSSAPYSTSTYSAATEHPSSIYPMTTEPFVSSVYGWHPSSPPQQSLLQPHLSALQFSMPSSSNSGDPFRPSYYESSDYESSDYESSDYESSDYESSDYESSDYESSDYESSDYGLSDRELGPSFFMRNDQFFVPGRVSYSHFPFKRPLSLTFEQVFTCLWTEPVGQTNKITKGSRFSPVWLGGWAYTALQRFVVVLPRPEQRFSFCW